MGKSHPQGNRLCSVQKCVRTVDIDEVGDNRHLTFFEMLGNWSLGDYFKPESIAWSYDFLINELNIPKEKLWVTVYGGDENLKYDQESHDEWLKVGIPEHKIVGIGAPTDPEKRRRKGRGDNFWAAGATGPCGPSSELFIWLGEGDQKQDKIQKPMKIILSKSGIMYLCLLNKRKILHSFRSRKKMLILEWGSNGSP